VPISTAAYWAEESSPPPVTDRVQLPPIAERPSIVVLPFENRSADPSQDFFAEGISEDILVELSKFKLLFVIARPSSFAHKGPDVNVRSIAKEFGVQHVVRGSVRRAGSKLRIIAQLLDGQTERQLWADRYDCEADELYDVQDTVVCTIASTLAGRVQAESLERAKRKGPATLDAYECLLRGKELHHRRSRQSADEALDMFARAIELDPDYAEAHCWYSCTLPRSSRWQGMGRGEAWKDVTSHLEKAYELNADEPDVHRILCELAMWQRDFDRAQYHQDRAIELNPNDERIVCQRGDLYSRIGSSEEAVEWVRKAMRLNPYHLNRWWSHLGRGLFGMGEYAEALSAFRRVHSPRLIERVFLAACAAAIGDTKQALSYAAIVRKHSPDFDELRFLDSLEYAAHYDFEPLIANLVLAGLA
jgi:adenylate cyclase